MALGKKGRQKDEPEDGTQGEKSSSGSAISGLRGLKNNQWLKENWWVVATLIVFFMLGVFLRAYFYWDVAVVDNGFLLTGNDPDYHKVVIDGVQATHHQPQWDPAMNYPMGGPDHNPALFEWSIALLGYVFAPFFGGNLAQATWVVFEMSPAFWGGLLVFPVFALTREMFGKKAGLLSAFLIATMSSNIERSSVGYADHDAFVLFFIVLTFFFFMRALKVLRLKNYVADWTKLHEIRDGFAAMVRDNKVAIGYSLMSATALTVTALAWKGFPYVMVIMGVYFVVQVFVNVIKKIDSFSTFAITTLALGMPLLMLFPYYAAASFLSPWFKDPMYVFLAVMVLGLYMSSTRDMPSMVSMGTLAGIIAAAYAVVHFQFPAVEKELISGMGYFVQSKIYETIAEAQPSDYSRLVFSFGIVTFYVALVGVAYLIYKFPKDQKEHSLFMMVWAIAGVYMALSAVRFMANATPLFATLAGWVTYEVVKAVDYKKFVRSYASMSGGGRFNALKKSLKPTHVLGVLFVAGLVIIPNVYYGLDAAIPYENKKEFDKKIYEAFPEGDIYTWHVSMKPPKDKYNVSDRNSLWYLGAFGMSMPQDYWVDGLRWLAEQDNQSSLMQKPAFVSWWDYGHWARHMGDHPTVSDNFQEGVQISGSMISAQNESQEIAYYIVRIMESEPGSAGMRAVLSKYLDDDNINRLVDIYKNPAKYKKEVLADPEYYTIRTKDLSDENAKYVAAAMLLTHKLDVDKLADLYHDVQTYTGYSIRYFAVDSRLFPFSATNTGIYYAPIKLSDQNIDDFMVVRAVSENGIEYPTDDIPTGVKIVDYKLIYKEPFYKSMFYKTYIGFSGNDLGMGDAGIPGLGGQLAQYTPMQGWMMKHFRVAYRTAYYNPYNYTDVKNHTEDWKAISYDKANQLDKNGDSLVDNADGVVDRRGGLYQGVFILKYYDGAVVSGKVMTEDGKPIPNARVTCYDDSGLEGVIPGIPHDSVMTDANGSYSIIVPYGNVTLITSMGGLDTTNPYSMMLQMETTPINTTNLTVTDDQAMRREKSLNPDGTPDWQIKKDIVVKAGSLEGKIFLDKNSNGAFDSGVDELIYANASQIKLKSSDGYVEKTPMANETANGTYKFEQIMTGSYTFVLDYNGHKLEYAEPVSIESDTTTTKDIFFQPSSINGTVEHQNGTNAEGEVVKLVDKSNNNVIETKCDKNGFFEFKGLLAGNYTVVSSVPGYMEIMEDRTLASGDNQTVNMTLVQASTVTGQLALENSPLANARVEFRSNFDGSITNVSITNATGVYNARLPKGKYTITSRYTKNSDNYILLDEIEVDGTTQGIDMPLEMQRAVKVSGYTYSDFIANGKLDQTGANTETGSEALANTRVEFEDADGAVMNVPSNATGYYQVYLPEGEYTLRATVKVGGIDYAYLDSITVQSQPVSREIPLIKAIRVSGAAYYDKDRSGGQTADDDKLTSAKITFTDPSGRSISTTSGEGIEAGLYVAYLPPGRIYTATLEKEGFVTSSQFLDLVNDNKTVDLFASALNRSVSGTLFCDGDDDGIFDMGEALSGHVIPIKFEPVPHTGALAAEATCDVTGKFTVNGGISPGQYYIVSAQQVTEGGNDVKYLYNETVEILPGTLDYVYNLSMTRGIKVTGTVRSDSTTVQPSIPITFWGEKEYETVSDGLGNYEIFVKPGLYSVCVYATPSTPMSYVHASTLNVSDSMNYDIMLEQGTRISGDLVFSGLTNYLGAEVVFGSSGKMKAETDINGHYSILLPPNRNYTVSVNFEKNESASSDSAEGFEEEYVASYRYNSWVILANLTIFDHDINLTRYIKVTGNVFYDANKNSAMDDGEGKVTGINFTVYGLEPIHVEGNGTYEAFLIEGKDYMANVDAKGFVAADASWRITPSPHSTVLNLSMTPMAVNLKGHVYVDANGNGVYDAGEEVAAKLTLTKSGTTQKQEYNVGANGTYQYDWQSPGEYEVYAETGAVAGKWYALNDNYTLEPSADAVTHDIKLVKAYHVIGDISYYNTHGEQYAPTNITLYIVGTDNSYSKSITCNESYDVVLLPGKYNITTTYKAAENNVNISYSYMNDFELNMSILGDVAEHEMDVPLEMLETYGIVLTLISPAQTLPANAGGLITYQVNVKNDGNKAGNFSLTAYTSEAGWKVTAGTSEGTKKLSLQSGAEQIVTATIEVPVDAKVTHLPITMRVTADDSPSTVKSIDLPVTIEQFYDLNFTYDKAKYPPQTTGNATQYTLELRNKGNGNDAMNITVDPNIPLSGWKIEISNPNPVVAGNTTQTITVICRPPSVYKDSIPSIKVTLIAKSSSGKTATVEFPVTLANLKADQGDVKISPTDAGKKPLVSTPGFELYIMVIAIAALVGVVVWSRRRDML